MLKTDDFDFTLPADRIASRPLPEREAARLLHLSGVQDLYDRQVLDLPSLVREGDIWVLNDTKVLPARLLGRKATGGRVELLLIEPLQQAHHWRAWGRCNKPLKIGTEVLIAKGFSASILARQGKQLDILLQADDVAEAIDRYGHMPLPPYIDRPDREEDKQRYQTVFARHLGAVAAPTAGLHLSDALMQAMQAKGACFEHITLHVGPGTFQPVQVAHLSEHHMHEEAYHIDADVAARINAAKAAGRRIIAVGTTSARTLEAACKAGLLQAGSGRTSIFMAPGYRFRMLDALLTNFHLPKSTLIMLVSALAGRQRVLQAYQHAIEQGYRFYSYGDAMFIEP